MKYIRYLSRWRRDRNLERYIEAPGSIWSDNPHRSGASGTRLRNCYIFVRIEAPAEEIRRRAWPAGRRVEPDFWINECCRFLDRLVLLGRLLFPAGRRFVGALLIFDGLLFDGFPFFDGLSFPLLLLFNGLLLCDSILLLLALSRTSVSKGVAPEFPVLFTASCNVRGV